MHSQNKILTAEEFYLLKKTSSSSTMFLAFKRAISSTIYWTGRHLFNYESDDNESDDVKESSTQDIDIKYVAISLLKVIKFFYLYLFITCSFLLKKLMRNTKRVL